AILSREALENLWDIAGSYSNLEYDLSAGRRGSRYAPVVELLCRLTGAESALVVNNNAAAVFLALQTLAQGREVIVSRGQLIEIGGSFRIPDIMRSSGAILREVGTTNKTHPSDYRAAINEQTALLLKVHTSNYRIVGFTEEVSLEELVRIGQEYQIPVMEDLGSGNFLDFSRYGLTPEPTVQEVVQTGVDVVTFSGDKLLGGPQAGIIVGKKVYIDQIRTNPLNRALRIDKMTIAALEATLRLYLEEETVVQKNPTLRMLTMSLSEIHKRAEQLRQRLVEVKGPEESIEICDDSSQVGGGAMPLQVLPTRVVAISSSRYSAGELEEKFRAHTPPVIGRIQHDRFLLDVRTIQEEEVDEVVDAFRSI
ncbi:MAG: L-seryl-tRNA(Sec) selenium transferase, partial [Nitrospinota bacterium]